jgi:hypothetical protein
VGPVHRHIRSNVVGYVALFVALSGVAYAGSAVPKNSVSSSSIKKGAVKGSDVGNESLTGTDISEGTLSQVPSAGLLDNLDSTAFVQDTDAAGGDLTGAFSSLSIAGDAVGAAELDEDTVGPQHLAPNGTPGVSGAVPIMWSMPIDNGNDVSRVAPVKLLITHVWTIGKSADIGDITLEAPGDAAITNAIDPTEDTIVPATTIDPGNWGLDPGDVFTADASNSQVDSQVLVLALPNIAP